MLSRLALALVAVGVVARLVRYLLCFPLWGDEASVCVNLAERDFLGLTRQLECDQVAPLLFLWSARAACLLFGACEFSVRLVPLLAGLLSLALFWRLARALLPPLGATLAIGLLAVGRWPVTMSANAKPYSLDLLMALALLVAAVEWLRAPDRPRWLVLLAGLTPLALLASYPAVFVAGAVSVALLPAVWRSGRGARVLFVLFNVGLLAAFLGSYGLVGREQIGPAQGSVGAYLREYWAHGFPPASPWPLLKWLLLTHTGRMMAYPSGDANGGSAVTFGLFAAGAWIWWKAKRRALLALMLLPFTLNLLAAALQRYPYGGCCRLSQHLAPAVCLLAAAGGAALLERFVQRETARLRWAGAFCALLVLFAAGGMVCDVARPYRDLDALWTRATVRQALAAAGPNDQVVVIQRRRGVPSVLRWYLDTADERARWNAQVDWERLRSSGGHLWAVDCWRQCPTPFQAPGGHGWSLVESMPHTLPGRKKGEADLHCDLFRWVPLTCRGPS
jgi:hypothetical protein